MPTDVNTARRIYFLDPSTKIEVYFGELYEFKFNMSTRSGITHMVGDELHVLSKTLDTPYDEVGPHGYNHICRTKHGDSCWSTLEQCIERGLLKKIGTRDPNVSNPAPLAPGPPKSVWQRLMENDE